MRIEISVSLIYDNRPSESELSEIKNELTERIESNGAIVTETSQMDELYFPEVEEIEILED